MPTLDTIPANAEAAARRDVYVYLRNSVNVPSGQARISAADVIANVAGVTLNNVQRYVIDADRDEVVRVQTLDRRPDGTSRVWIVRRREPAPGTLTDKPTA
jgi:hypothetical protein